MKKLCVLIGFLVLQNIAQAQILEIIQALTTKVIKAIDLKVQRLQYNTIVLQDAQKELENVLSKLKLQEIADWVQKQKDLYSEYFDELAQIKSYITEYHRVKELIAKQAAIVSDYQRAMALFRQDSHFSAAELQHMEAVYQGILSESLQWLGQVSTVLQALVTKMTDEQRMHTINKAADQIDKNYSDTASLYEPEQDFEFTTSKRSGGSEPGEENV